VTFLHRPNSVEELLKTRHDLPDALILAGGAGVMKALHKRAEPAHDVIDLSGVEELVGIQVGRFGTWLGSMTSLLELSRDPLIRKHHPCLADACSHGPPQVRARVSIGGVVAWHRYEVLPALMVLGARSEFRGHETLQRRARVQETVTQVPGRSEVIVALHLPAQAEGERLLYRRIEGGSGDVVIAGRLQVSDGRVKQAALVIGTPDQPGLHLAAVEEALVAEPIGTRPIALMEQAYMELDPEGTVSGYARASSARVLRSWLEHLS
jgi:CO/xanthine dehydrogenase FAD-binding subunit